MPKPAAVPIATLAAEFARLRPEHTSAAAVHRNLAARYGLSEHTIRRRLNEYAPTTQAVTAPFVLLHKPQNRDAEQWADTLSDLRRKNEVVTAHKCDIHAPYGDGDALALDNQTTAYMQPDVIVVGSDFADFPTISSFAADPDLGNEDILDTLRPHWWRHIDALKRAAPKAVLVWIEGNHETRLWRFLDETAPQIRQTAREAFIDLIRYQGRVLYLGRISEIQIGALTILHGDRSCIGDMAARKLLTARRFQGWFMFGHNHKWTEYITVGHERQVGAAGSGHLGIDVPHYQKTTMFNQWTKGTCYATVDMKADYVWFDNLIFNRVGDTLATRIGNRVFAQAVAADDAQGRAA